MNAQVSFVEGTYTLIHIPLDLYSTFIQPILRVLLPQTQTIGSSARDGPERELQGLSLDNTSPHQGFLNISVTPLEASVVCRSTWAHDVFEPILRSLPREAARSVELSSTEYTVLAVISAGLDAAGRVLELTSPLAQAGIPIFFISTYYSDFILAPEKERPNIIKALDANGFQLLSDDPSQFTSPISPHYPSRSTTPPTPSGESSPSTRDELQTRAFDLLRKRNVSPRVDDDLELVQCSGRELPSVTDDGVYGGGGAGHSRHHHTSSRGRNPVIPNWVDALDTRLYTCIIAALISHPRFISVTLAQDDPPSLLIDKTLLPLFGDSIVGDTEGCHIPIFLDLVSLPFEVTGIVCGVAGKLMQDMQLAESSELSYLSTARAGAVILPEAQSRRALDILRPLLIKE